MTPLRQAALYTGCFSTYPQDIPLQLVTNRVELYAAIKKKRISSVFFEEILVVYDSRFLCILTSMTFERFDKAAAVAVTKPPRVAVSTSGVISLTWQAYELLNRPEYVEFFYDAEREVIALGSATDSSNAYQVRMPRPIDGSSEARGSVSVRGETFLKYYKIPYQVLWRRIPWLEGDLLCFSVPADRVLVAREGDQHREL